MKILIAYYSRSGTTKKAAQMMSEIFTEIVEEEVEIALEEIIDKKNRKGFVGALFSIFDALTKKPTVIEPMKNPINQFDLLIIGTPVWVSSVPGSIRTFFQKYRKEIQRAAFFCTMGSSGDQKTLQEMTKLLKNEPVEIISFREKDVKKKTRKFCSSLQGFVKKLTDIVVP